MIMMVVVCVVVVVAGEIDLATVPPEQLQLNEETPPASEPPQTSE